MLNTNLLDEMVFALRRERDAYEANGVVQESELFDQYADAVDFSVRHVKYGTKLSQEEIDKYYQQLLRLTAPHMI